MLTLGAGWVVACGSSPGSSVTDASTVSDGRVDGHSDARRADGHADARLADAHVDGHADSRPADGHVDAHADARSTDGRVEARADSNPADAWRADVATGDALSRDAHAHDGVAEAGDSGTVDARARDGVAETGDAGLCHASGGPADRTRRIVVSHPYDVASNPSSDFEVFDLSQAGVITEPDVHFQLGVTTNGAIAFTPDGLVGIVAEDDGSLGVFRFDVSGTPHVVSASMTGSYYATGVVMDPSGARAYILDDQTVDNGGGIYTVAIACDGSLHDDGLLAAADLPAAIVPVAGGNAVIAAQSFLNVPPLDAGSPDSGPDAALAVLVPWPSASKVIGTANPFEDDLAIVSSAALTQDGRYVLIGDNNAFSEPVDRIGIVAVGAGTLAASGVVPNVNDPETIVTSPFDDTVLVTSAFGNALFILRPSVDAGPVPFRLAGQVTYTGPAPELPGVATMIDRGTLRGRVLVAENQAIRQVQFAGGGVVSDLGPTYTGDVTSYTSIVGAMGVQP